MSTPLEPEKLNKGPGAYSRIYGKWINFFPLFIVVRVVAEKPLKK